MCIHAYSHTLIHSYTHTLIHAYTHTLIHSYTHTLMVPTLKVTNFEHSTRIPFLVRAPQFPSSAGRRATGHVSGLQAYKLLQIYINTDYCLVAFCTWIPPTRWRLWTCCPVSPSSLVSPK
jgi:hypothetical protein